MIAAAEKNVTVPSNLTYIHNPEPNLSVFESNQFDFVLSYYVLQHIHPRLAEIYLREFVRVLKPGGILAFQSVSGRVRTAKGLVRGIVPTRLEPLLHRIRFGSEPRMEMHGMSVDDVEKELRSAGASITATIPENVPGQRWTSWVYLAEKSHTV